MNPEKLKPGRIYYSKNEFTPSYAREWMYIGRSQSGLYVFERLDCNEFWAKSEKAVRENKSENKQRY